MSALVHVVGNIGSGKSLLLETIHRYNDNWTVAREQVKVWSGEEDFSPGKRRNFLHTGVHRGGLEFVRLQQAALVGQFKSLQPYLKFESCLETPFVQERDLYSSVIFSRAAALIGKLDQVDVDVIQYTAETLLSVNKDLLKPDLIIYIESDPKVCLERVKNRRRRGEEVVDIRYLVALHESHTQWKKDNFHPLEPKEICCVPASVKSPGDVYSHCAPFLLRLVFITSGIGRHL